jgi:hypothetical protein
MNNTRIKINSVVENQLPLFVRENFPLVEEFLREYYKSLDLQGGVYDILQNIDEQIKVDNSSNTVESTALEFAVGFLDRTVTVSSTVGFPDYYGLIKIDSEIILYKKKTDTTFEDCVRGFSAISSYTDDENFIFEDTLTETHSEGSIVTNLSVLFLKEFYNKTKKQFLPGFEGRSFYEDLNTSLFLKSSKDFYSSKGTDEAFKILFRVLFGKDVSVIKPRDYLIQPSDAKYRVTRDIVVEEISGNIEELKNKTIFEKSEGEIKSFATVTDIEKIYRNRKYYYILKLDSDFNKDINVVGSVFGNFSITPKTKVVETVPLSADTIIVDSTIGFPESGILRYTGLGGNILISYNQKSITEFKNCTGITESIPSKSQISLNPTNSYAYGLSNDGSEIRFRVNGVISNTNADGIGKYYSKNDTGKIISFGYNSDEDVLSNNWIFNVSVNCQVSSLIDNQNFSYTITTYDNNNIYNNDHVEISYANIEGIRKTNIFKVVVPTGSEPQKTFRVNNFGENIREVFSVRKVISKYDGKFVSDVINTYKDTSKNNEIYVASNSLPNYDETTISDYKISIRNVSNNTINYENHGYYSGDAIIYTFSSDSTTKLNISSGIYYIKKIDEDNFKLASSKENIFFGKYLSIGNSNISDGNFISPLKFANKENLPGIIEPQKLIRKISEPQTDGEINPTKKGTTGIFLNGVELLNYKSEDIVYYGPIESIDVIDEGEDYDIINPPKLVVSVGSGSSATGYCGVEGSLNKIEIVDPGFDYISNPQIKISGGGGSGAVAEANTIPIENIINFNSTSTNTKIKPLNPLNEIGFSTSHRLRTGELVNYSSNGQPVIGGLLSGSNYYVRVLDDFSIKLYNTFTDSTKGQNEIDITGYGEGNHTIKSIEKKFTLGSISIINPGSGYKNKKITVKPIGVNTFTDTIEVYDHPYQSGEIIHYDFTGTSIAGLSTGSYYLTRIDSKNFKLSEVGVGTIAKDFYYVTKQYVNFESSGLGTHIFNYEPIVVSISGYVGASTSIQQDFNSVLQPIFSGNIKSIYVENGGVGYGSSEILNFNKQPLFSFESGSEAKIAPLVSGGKIVKVIVTNSGSNYKSPPKIIISGSGFGASLTPIIENGQLKEVKIINGGLNYTQNNTTLEVVPYGSGCKLNAQIKRWVVNKFNRLSKKFGPDESVVYKGLNPNYGLQYTHLNLPQVLRKKLFSKTIQDERVVFRKDLDNDTNAIKLHSPIVGWAYDGNPIYGPYGYTSTTNKTVKKIISGYSDAKDIGEGRPSSEIYESGFFVEDYEYTANGDLDENNGRFCITPEFPNGTYAYFCTLDENDEPKFPYVIGKNFKSTPIDYNFEVFSGQDTFDFSNKFLLRNTYPYNSKSKNSSYDFIFENKNEYRVKNSKVETTTKGSIDSIKIISGGQNYSVGDNLIFDEEGTEGTGAIYTVETVGGKKVNQIDLSSSIFEDVEFSNIGSNKKIIGFSTIPHNFSNGDKVNITSLNNNGPQLKGSFEVFVNQNKLLLTVGVGDSLTDGVLNYFSVNGNLDYPNIRENDVYTIDSEKIKILNVDKKSRRIRVLRGYEGTPTSAHSGFTTIFENSRKFEIIPKLQGENYFSDREIYFDPSESVGLGYTETTINFSNPGAGETSITTKPRSIFIKNHNLKSGTLVIYNSNGGSPLFVSKTGVTTFQLNENSEFYVTKLTDDFIGISTDKVGLNTNGEYLNSKETEGLLYFDSVGVGSYHSFKTKIDDVSLYNVTKNDVTVSTATTHSLQKNDFVVLDVISGIQTSYKIEYNDYYRRIIINKAEFLASDVDTINSTIRIPRHNLITGQKVIYNSTSPSGGLDDNKIYYVVKYDENRIRLSNSKYDSEKQNPSIIDITTSSVGTISPINPPIQIIKNSKLVFDVSDQSLSVFTGIERESSFNINFYNDKKLSDRLFLVDTDGNSKIRYTGRIGVDLTAKIELLIDSSFPDNFYYSLDPILFEKNKNEKIQIQVDDEVNFRNSINLNTSSLSGVHRISSKTLNTFTYVIGNTNEIGQYTSQESNISYRTNSKTETGEIKTFSLKSKGFNYHKLPSIKSVDSDSGSGAILIPESNEIGKIKSTKIFDIGYDYSIDSTIKPLVKYPSVLRIEPLSKISSIGITSIGVFYNTSPNLILIDGFTKNVVDDVVLDFDVFEPSIKIIKNTTELYNTTPIIIPTNNTNGLKISSASFDSLTKKVTLVLSKQFSSSDVFPFSVGDNIIVEGISITPSNGIGFNSKNYNYNLFKITDIDPKFGGSGAFVKYSLSELLTGSQTPGTFDSENSSGTVTPEKYFPKFDISLIKNSFAIGETVRFGTKIGKVTGWDEKNEFLRIETDFKYDGELEVQSLSSSSKAFIKETDEFESFYSIDSSSIVKNGWIDRVGFLNDGLQKISDNDYYQYFSYSLKSEIDFDTWDITTDNLNHTVGFKKFGDLQIVSELEANQTAGISTQIVERDLVIELNSVVDVNCTFDYDLVTENSLTVDNVLSSNQINFASRIIQDYSESIGNRVLLIDDISGEFNTQIPETFVTSFNI